MIQCLTFSGLVTDFLQLCPMPEDRVPPSIIRGGVEGTGYVSDGQGLVERREDGMSPPLRPWERRGGAEVTRPLIGWLDMLHQAVNLAHGLTEWIVLLLWRTRADVKLHEAKVDIFAQTSNNTTEVL